MSKGTTDYDRELGARISTIRRDKKLSQTDLGKILGVTFQQVQKYEKGANRIPANRLSTIAEFLGVPVSELVGADGTSAAQAQTFSAEALQLATAYDGLPSSPIKRAFLDLLTIAYTTYSIRTA